MPMNDETENNQLVNGTRKHLFGNIFFYMNDKPPVVCVTVRKQLWSHFVESTKKFVRKVISREKCLLYKLFVLLILLQIFYARKLFYCRNFRLFVPNFRISNQCFLFMKFNETLTIGNIKVTVCG